FQSRFHVVDRIVDNGVGANFHLFAVGQAHRAAIGAHGEGDDDAVRSARQVDVVLVDGTHAARHDFDAHLFVGQFLQALAHGFDRTLAVGLDDDVELLDFALLNLGENVLQGNAALIDHRTLLLGSELFGLVARGFGTAHGNQGIGSVR